MYTKYFISTFVLLSFSLVGLAQSFDYEKTWAQVQTYEKKALPNKAFQATEAILQAALEENNQPQLLKALLSRTQYRQRYQEDYLLKTIEELEAYLPKIDIAEKAMLQVALADAYQSYFSTHQWLVRNIKTVEGHRPVSIKEWSTTDFLQKTDSLFASALQAKEALEKLSTRDWKIVFRDTDKHNVQIYDIQQTLYDFVLWKAIQYYSQNELLDMAKEEAFLLNNKALLQDHSAFLRYQVPADYQDTHKAKLIQAYQTFVQHYQNESLPLLYAEQKRLQYFKSQALIENKDTILLNTYKHLYQSYKGKKGEEWIAMGYIETLSAKTQNEEALQTALGVCQSMVATKSLWPYFKEKQQQLQQPQIDMRFNEVNENNVLLPNQSALLYVNTKNTTRLWFRIIQLSPDEPILQGGGRANREKEFDKYTSRKAVKSFSETLFSQPFLASKTALMSMPALDYGVYMLLASDREDFNPKKANMQMRMFWVSNIRLVEQVGMGDYMVVHRKTGAPIQGAKVEVVEKHWDKPAGVLLNTFTTNDKGAFSLGNVDNSIEFKISKGQDYWQSGRTYHNVNKYQERTIERHYLFTDRAIYRPGQRVHFKAILTTQKGDSVQLLTNKEVVLRFYSAQGKELHKTTLVSNDFGSVSGHFDCPLQGLNGNMRISTGNGSVSFRMEAYKRPKFQVAFDKPTTTMQLGQEVHVTGKADYYMGSPVANAKVVYRVERKAYFPWWRIAYYNIPPFAAQDIAVASGHTTTDAQGAFSIDFTALAADKSQEYRYIVTADVTDPNGETHTQETALIIGKESIQIYAEMPKVMDKAHLKEVAVNISNLQMQPLVADWQLKIERLNAPGKRFMRLLDFDKNLISSQAQDQDFPLVCFDTTLYKLQVEKEVYSAKFSSQESAEIAAAIWQKLPVGHYQCTLSTQDESGAKVQSTYEVMLISSKDKAVPPMNEMLLYTAQNTLKVDDTYQFVINKPKADIPVFYRISAGRDILSADWQHSKDSYAAWTGKVLPAYRGGLSIQVFYAWEGEWHSQELTCVVPYNNKTLDIQLKTFRSALDPGQKEQWQLLITDDKQNGVSAELMAGMYDKSLDALAPHSWQWQLFPQKRGLNAWKTMSTSRLSYDNIEEIYPRGIKMPGLLAYLWRLNREPEYDMYAKGMRGSNRLAGAMPMTTMVEEEVETEIAYDAPTEEDTTITDDSSPITHQSRSSIRKNLRETAFFYPQLHSNAQGAVQIDFEAPEALSEWKLMLLAYTKQVQNAIKTESCQTQKELMILPHLPRFFRGGDKIAISARVLSMTDKTQIANASLELLDANTGKLLSGGTFLPRQVELQPQGQSEVAWEWEVPENIGAVIVRLYAKGNKHQDAEEHLLPVLSPMVYLTDTYPFTLYGNQQIAARDMGLQEGAAMQDERLTFEVVSNPLWYVVQALPNYTKPKHPSAVSWAYYYFVQSMGKYVVDANPEIEKVFAQWQQSSPDAFESKLAQNQDLKTVLLEQTPWVLDAQSEKDRHLAIANYFADNQHSYNMIQAIEKLQKLQLSSGAWAWFEGMQASPYITAQVLKLLGDLHAEGIVNIQAIPALNDMCRKAVKYLDLELVKKYEYNQSHGLNKDYAGYLVSARALFLQLYPVRATAKKAFDTFLDIWQAEANHLSIVNKRALANVLLLSGNTQAAKEAATSIADHALREKDGAVYWRDFAYFHSAEQQARTLLLFENVDMPQDLLKGMKLWLLKQKRTQDWGDHAGTAWACLAMLKQAPLLSATPDVKLWIDGKPIDVKGRSGSGYFKRTWTAKAGNLENIAANVKVEVAQAAEDGVVFGAFYRQGFVHIKEVEAHQGGMALDKSYLLAQTTPKGVNYTPISDAKNIPLGSTLVVRLRFSSQQAMDFVHLQDALPSGFEVQNPLSSCQWEGGLFFYRAIGDNAVDFFISHLPKGEYMLEYNLFVSALGTLSVGPSTIQSTYAPEFGGHSEGGELVIGDRR